MFALILQVTLAHAVSPCIPPAQEVGLASGYTPHKKSTMMVRGVKVYTSNARTACGYKPGRKYPLIAHRTLRCGTKVYVRLVRTGRGVWARVGDRGPYGACARKQDLSRRQIWMKSKWCRKRYSAEWVWAVKTRKRHAGIHRGIADLSPRVRKAIGHNGMEPVALHYKKKVRKYVRVDR